MGQAAAAQKGTPAQKASRRKTTAQKEAAERKAREVAKADETIEKAKASVTAPVAQIAEARLAKVDRQNGSTKASAQADHPSRPGLPSPTTEAEFKKLVKSMEKLVGPAIAGDKLAAADGRRHAGKLYHFFKDRA